MHRSGTSLLSRVLDACNIHMGRKQNIHDEAIFYKDLNDDLLSKVHSFWDAPLNASFLNNDASAIKNLAAFAKKKHNSWRYKVRYTGWSKFDQWGWKDPRTILTLPVYKEIFPNAKYITIIRNGVDVAVSLYNREISRLHRNLNANISIRCRDLMEAFKLWEEYNHIYQLNKLDIPTQNLLEIRYEVLVQNPNQELPRLLQFINTDVPNIEDMASGFRSDSLFSFKNSTDAVKLYQKVEKTQYMMLYEYTGLLK